MCFCIYTDAVYRLSGYNILDSAGGDRAPRFHILEFKNGILIDMSAHIFL